MDHEVTFVGTFRIPDYQEWLTAIRQMTEFVKANVPGVISFHAYANADGDEGTVVYVHPNGDSFDQHLGVAADLIREGTAMVDVTRVELLGSPNPGTVARLRASGLPVSVKAVVSGFVRD